MSQIRKPLAVTLLAISLVIVPCSPAQAGYRQDPPQGESAAYRRTLKLLRSYPGWCYRQHGYVDCRRGKINWHTWTCRVGWARANRCRFGRVRVTTDYSEAGVTYYHTNTSLRRCVYSP